MPTRKHNSRRARSTRKSSRKKRSSRRKSRYTPQNSPLSDKSLSPSDRLRSYDHHSRPSGVRRSSSLASPRDKYRHHSFSRSRSSDRQTTKSRDIRASKSFKDLISTDMLHEELIKRSQQMAIHRRSSYHNHDGNFPKPSKLTKEAQRIQKESHAKLDKYFAKNNRAQKHEAPNPHVLVPQIPSTTDSERRSFLQFQNEYQLNQRRVNDPQWSLVNERACHEANLYAEREQRIREKKGGDNAMRKYKSVISSKISEKIEGKYIPRMRSICDFASFPFEHNNFADFGDEQISQQQEPIRKRDRHRLKGDVLNFQTMSVSFSNSV